VLSAAELLALRSCPVAHHSEASPAVGATCHQVKAVGRVQTTTGRVAIRRTNPTRGWERASLTRPPLAISDDLYVEVQRRAAAEGTTDAAVGEAAMHSCLGPDGLIDRSTSRRPPSRRISANANSYVCCLPPGSVFRHGPGSSVCEATASASSCPWWHRRTPSPRHATADFDRKNFTASRKHEGLQAL
jgi:hypothetical protein